MNTDIRMIRLTKNIVRNQDPAECDEREYLGNNNGSYDVMKAESAAPLAAIMGTCSKDGSRDSMIFFSLYCDSDMLQYQSSFPWHGDPLSEGNSSGSLPFLNVIQVHIMPDAILHAPCQTTGEKLTEIFYHDLCDAVGEFRQKLPDHAFTLRIYKMLSSGDFALAMQSSRAETPALLSSLLRRRKSQSSSDNVLPIALYTVYPLLTHQDNIDPNLCQKDVEADDILLSSESRINFSPVSRREDLLICKIKGKFQTIQDKYISVRNDIAQIPYYRKNMLYYVGLLGKLILLCDSINCSPDTRAFAVSLLEQLEVIIDSINIYITIYENSDEHETILDLLEDYIRESVWALDSYATYIRNSIFQLTQIPSYNLESNMNMEKMLIGYGEMLSIFIEYYQHRQPCSQPSRMDARQLLPIVVPALHKRDVSVEILFMDGVLSDWESESPLWQTTGEDEIRQCMVVSIPTLSDLTNVQTMVISLFHEVAHQFRYETRKRRNAFILRYVIHTSMQQLARVLTRKLQWKLHIYDSEEIFTQFLTSRFTAAYLEYYRKNDKNLKFNLRTSPLNGFQADLVNHMAHCLTPQTLETDIHDMLADFLKALSLRFQDPNDRYSGALLLLENFLHISTKGKPTATCDQITNCAYVLALECAYQNKGDSKISRQKWEYSDLTDWVTNTGFFDYIADWDQHFGPDSHGERSGTPLNDIWHIFNGFSHWVYTNYSENLMESNTKDFDKFLKHAHKSLCRNWKDQKKEILIEFSPMARMLGIDHDTDSNYEIFKSELSDILYQELDGILNDADWTIKKYREETADMLMCSVLDLSPLGYINLLAVNWPVGGDVTDEYISRCTNVFLFQWCLNEQYDIDPAAFMDQCNGMVRNLAEMVTMIQQKLCGNGYVSDRFTEDADMIKDLPTDRLLEILSAIELWCDPIYTQMLGGTFHDSDIAPEDIRTCRNMATLMRSPIAHGENIISYLDEYKELKEDYIRGAKYLHMLNLRMRGEKSDSKIQQLGEFCKTIGSWQNDPGMVLADPTQLEEQNTVSLNFLLDMYYSNKQRVLQEVDKK